MEPDAQSIAKARAALVLGGARSGKSAYAQGLAEEAAPLRLYLATAAAGDAEMGERIARHQAGRGEGWTTLEAPLELAEKLASNARGGQVVLVDCLTLWIANLLLAGRDPEREIGRLAEAVATLGGPAVLVSNEVGMGIVPESRLGRDFRDWQGRVNREIAQVCDAVVLVAAGLSLLLKPAPRPALQLR